MTSQTECANSIAFKQKACNTTTVVNIVTGSTLHFTTD